MNIDENRFNGFDYSSGNQHSEVLSHILKLIYQTETVRKKL